MKNRTKLLLGGLVKGYLLTELMGLFVFLFFWALHAAMGLAANIIFGVVGILTVFCIVADYGLKQGEKARQRVKLHGEKPCRSFGAAIGAVASLPNYLSLIVLALSRAGAIGNFLPAYKLINAYFFPLTDLVAHSADVMDMHPAAFVLLAVLPLFFVFSGWMSFRWGYDQVDLKSKVLYKNNEK